MEPNRILQQAIQALGNIGQKVVNTPVLPFIPQSTFQNLLTRPPGTFTTQPFPLQKPVSIDPGSYYGNFKQDPKNAMMAAVMAMATPVTPTENALSKISNMDRGVMGQFVEAIESGKARQPLDELGNDAANIAKGLGVPETATNQTVANHFNNAIKAMDEQGIKPVIEPGTYKAAQQVVQNKPSIGGELTKLDNLNPQEVEQNNTLSNVRVGKLGNDYRLVYNDIGNGQRGIYDKTFSNFQDAFNAAKTHEQSRVALNSSIDNFKPMGGISTGGEIGGSNPLDSIINRYGKKIQAEASGNQMLDSMAQRKISPQDTANQFWSNTFDQLPKVTQDKMVKLLEEHTGMKLGYKGTTIQDMVKNIDLGNDVNNLQGTERGFATIMQYGNDQVKPQLPKPSSSGEIPKGVQGK